MSDTVFLVVFGIAYLLFALAVLAGGEDPCEQCQIDTETDREVVG